MSQLTTLALVKGALRIPAGITVHDARITRLAELADGDILKECKGLTSLVATTYSGYFRGCNTSVALIEPWPVFGVVAITSCGSAVDEDEYKWSPSGVIELYDGIWPESRAALHVTFTAGLVAVVGQTPTDLERWATLHAARNYYIEWMAGMKEEDVKPIRRRVADPDLDTDSVLREIAILAANYRRP